MSKRIEIIKNEAIRIVAPDDNFNIETDMAANNPHKLGVFGSRSIFDARANLIINETLQQYRRDYKPANKVEQIEHKAMSKELLLQYARGGADVRPSYFVMYHVTSSGEVVIHSCERQLGGDSTFIRLCPYDGTATEINALYVPDEKIEAAIEEFMDKQNTNG